MLPAGAIHPDLVRRLADEAAKSAGHVLNMCIRALDYLPPVDVTFFEYLRALITADFDLVQDDRYNYRVAFVEAFRRRGIYPRDLPTLSVDTLRWRGVDLSTLPRKQKVAVEEQYNRVASDLKSYADACLYIKNRETLFQETRRRRGQLKGALTKAFAAAPKFAGELGLKVSGGNFEVHALRPSLRIGPDGQHIPQILLSLTQTRTIKVDGEPHIFRGGSTLVIDLSKPEVKYRIGKRIDSESREDRTVAFLREVGQDPLRALLLAPSHKEPFAALHALADENAF